MNSIYKSGVYSITNKINGKMYIGSSSKGLDGRWKSHIRCLRRGKHHSYHLRQAWNKYGEGVFEFRVLFYWPAEPKQALLDMETAAIAVYKTCDPEFGYNILSTAGSSLGVKHTKEACANMSRAHIGKMTGPQNPNYGKCFSKETRDKISAGNKGKTSGNKHYLYGKHLPKETRAKLSAAKMGAKNPNYGKFGPADTRHNLPGANTDLIIPDETKEIIYYSPGGKYCGERARNVKLSLLDVEYIRELRKGGELLRELSSRFGVSISQINRICNGKSWK